MRRDWTKVLLKPEQSIRDALVIINSQALRVALVVAEDNQLLGVITDGDIRRSILNNVDINAPVSVAMNVHPTVVEEGLPKAHILALMQQKSLLVIPVVDDQKRLIGLETLEQALAPKHYDNPVFIMAGGFGTRLRPLTDNCPKPMLKIGDKPILETILQKFICAGFSRFYISTHFMPEIIENYFGNGERWGVDITYVYEDTPLGTGGALGLLPDDVPDLPLIMINGDILTNVDFERLLDFHQIHSPSATMCVREFDYQIPYGVIKGDGHRIISMEEKPIQRYFVNAGIYIVSPDLFKNVPRGVRIDMPTLLEGVMERKHEVLMFPIHEYWLDIGRMDDFHRAQSDIYGLRL